MLTQANCSGIQVDLTFGGPLNAAASPPDLDLSEQVTVTQLRKDRVINQQRPEVTVNLNAIAVADTHNQWIETANARDGVHQTFLLARKNAMPGLIASGFSNTSTNHPSRF